MWIQRQLLLLIEPVPRFAFNKLFTFYITLNGDQPVIAETLKQYESLMMASVYVSYHRHSHMCSQQSPGFNRQFLFLLKRVKIIVRWACIACMFVHTAGSDGSLSPFTISLRKRKYGPVHFDSFVYRTFLQCDYDGYRILPVQHERRSIWHGPKPLWLARLFNVCSANTAASTKTSLIIRLTKWYGRTY